MATVDAVFPVGNPGDDMVIAQQVADKFIADTVRYVPDARVADIGISFNQQMQGGRPRWFVHLWYETGGRKGS